MGNMFDVSDDTTIVALFKAIEDKDIITYKNSELDDFQRKVINHIYENYDATFDDDEKTLGDIDQQFFAVNKDCYGNLTIEIQDGTWTHFEGAMEPESWLEDWMTDFGDYENDVIREGFEQKDGCLFGTAFNSNNVLYFEHKDGRVAVVLESFDGNGNTKLLKDTTIVFDDKEAFNAWEQSVYSGTDEDDEYYHHGDARLILRAFNLWDDGE
jgi:hypothetical protein